MADAARATSRPDPLQPILGAPWSELTAAHVEEFLADQDDEGQLWDCKVEANARGRSIAKDVCAFANTSGGYLILGAERTKNSDGTLGRWLTPGFTPPNPEAETWIVDKLMPVLNPLPALSVRALAREGCSPLVAVRVLPVPNPPCLLQGTPYVRTASVSAPVTDQGVLFELLHRGQQAQNRCEQLASQSSSDPSGLAELPDGSSRMSIGAAAVNYPEALGGRIHSKRFADTLIALMDEVIGPEPSWKHFVRLGPVEHRQDAVIIPYRLPVGAGPAAEEWWVRVGWAGEVSAVWTSSNSSVRVGWACGEEGPLRAGWVLAERVIHELGGHGAGRLYVTARSSAVGYEGLSTDWATAGRHLDLERELRLEDLASVEREFLRAAGVVSWEP